MRNFLTRIFQTILPHHTLSRVMHGLTRIRRLPFRDSLVRLFIRIYQVNMDEAVEADYTNRSTYPHINALFTRALKPEARPVAQQSGQVCSPVDGTISQLGRIRDGRIFQAKGFDYSLTELLGGSEERARPFVNGRFATLYLSPRDYHRIHMPLTGTLQESIHVPGRLFSVSPRCIASIPRLFTRNERVATLFDTEAGPMAVILVGAIFVGSIETVWAGEITPPAGKTISVTQHQDAKPPIRLVKGEELGRFNMGSTVIVLFGDQCVEWQEQHKEGQAICMGELLGEVTS